MSDYLPHEVWIDIFTRLPVKTLLQIRCVCKTWLLLISNPSLITTHINRTNHTQRLLLRHFTEKERHEKEQYLLFENDQTLGEHAVKLQFPFKTRSKYHFRIVGSCNGLLCLSDDYKAYAYSIILWNPSIRKFVTLPKPCVTQKTHGTYAFVLGFGFDFRNDDYKVVRIAYLRGRNGRDLIPPEVEVYALSSGCWRSFSTGAPPYGIYGYTSSHAFVNGAVHWIGYDPCVPKGSRNRSLIVSFDMADEVFRELMLPDGLTQCGWDLSVSEYGEVLSVLQYEHRAKKQFCSVWVMKEYGMVDSWTHAYTIDMREGLHKTVGFGKNGVVLLVSVRGKLFSYEPNTGRIEGLGLRGAIDSFYVGTYMESLVLLEGENAVLGADAIANEGGEEDAEALQCPRYMTEHGEERTRFGGRSEQEFYSEFCVHNYEWGGSKRNCEEWEK